MRTDSGHGTSRVAVEKFSSDAEYAAAKALVRDLMRDVEPTNDIERGMREHGVWSAHDVAWTAQDAFAVEENPQGIRVLRRRISGGIDALKRYAQSAREWVVLAALYRADELAIDEGNVFLNLGTEFLWRRATGVGTLDVLFDNSNARIGVGSSSTAAARTQTDLQGASKTYSPMEATFPTVTAGDASGGAKATFKTVFDSGEANHDHKEWVVDNKASTGTKVMNRKVQDFGTKASGSTWTYTFELRID